MFSPNLPALQQLHRLNRSSSEFYDQLYDTLRGKEYTECVPNLRGDDSVWLVEYLDNVLDSLDPASAAFRKCLRELRRVCGTAGIVPTSYTLPSSLLHIDPNPFASGGFGDVHDGTLDGSRVCIKRVRVYIKDGPQKATKIFCREAVIWKRLTHPNVLPLLGVTTTPPQLISSWMPGGDLLEYIEKHPSADRLGLSSGVAKGLCYLHSCNVIHGDLKGQNILVDGSDNALIADFGVATVTRNLHSVSSASGQHGHSARWTAPEILNGGPYSKEADVFAFAMVMIEVFTSAIPFSNDSSLVAMLATIQGKRPPRPTHPTFTEDLWALMQRCWDHDPLSRPEVLEASKALLALEHPAWKQLISYTLTMDEHIALVTAIFLDDNQIEIVECLSGDNAQSFVDAVDQVLDDLVPEIRGRCLRYLYRICGHQALLPKSLVIPLCYDPTGSPLYHGGSADVWKGQHCGQEVSAKVLRVYSRNGLGKIKSRFCREVVAWRALRHPNVLPLLGVTMTGNRFVMVSEWMAKGNINEFVKADIHADRLGLLGDVTEGLIYMHEQGMVHGNLNGANILIDNNGHACLTGFGLLTMVSDQPTVISSAMTGGAIRWMSPERFDPGKFGLRESHPTKESDRYALGMVIYEVLSGETPYALCNQLVVVQKIMDGERPKRPEGVQGAWFTAGLWQILELCWKPRPGDRPSLNVVLQCLRDVTSPPRSSDVGGYMEADINDQSDTATSDFRSLITRDDNRPPAPPRIGGWKDGWLVRGFWSVVNTIT